MHITELRLAGFKSFVDPVRAPIEAGLTGVVGPNGCGKSNLLEAVRWAMGTTSAKSMRADDMESVIFAGSAARPAREHAEVTLVLADAFGKAPGDFAKEDTLEISRRIRRGLGSTYRINGKEVRAKDVQLLFADASTGANSPALVRQGQVSELIAAKPENRRRILEEAAGVAGLHARRHEADLKLRAAETNLSRLEEILAEIEAQAAALRRQAKQAERYRGLAQAIRQHEALLLHRRWMALRASAAAQEEAVRACEREVASSAAAASASAAKLESLREGLAPLREEEMIAAAVLRRLEGVRVGLERDVQEAQSALDRLQADIARVDADETRERQAAADAVDMIARLERDISADKGGDHGDSAALDKLAQTAKHAEDARTVAEQAYEALARDAAADKARAGALAESAAAAERALKRVEDRARQIETSVSSLPDASALEARRMQVIAAADAARATADAAQAALADIEADLKAAIGAEEKAWSRHRESQAAADKLAAETRALEAIAAQPQKSKYAAVLGDVHVEPGYEKALAAALGEDLDASLDARAAQSWRGGEIPEVVWPDGVVSLNAVVRAPDALAARLALIGVVDDGLPLQKQLQPGMRLVSRNGDLWRWDGFVRTPAAPAPNAARLEQRNRLKAVRESLRRAQANAETAKADWEKAKTARAKANAAAANARAAALETAPKSVQAESIRDALAAEIARAKARREELIEAQFALAAERAEAEAALSAARDAASTSKPLDEAALEGAREAMHAARTEAADARAAVVSLQRDLEARAARIEAWKKDITLWRERGASAQTRLMALAAERKKLGDAAAQAAAKPEHARRALESLLAEEKTAEDRVKAAGDRVAESETAIREAEAAARDAERAHASAREARASAAARLTAVQERLTHEEAYALETVGQPSEALIGVAGPLAVSALSTGPLDDLEKKLDRLKRERDSAGPVNLRAEEELSEAQARITELSHEKADVEAAVTKLRRAIGQLNAEGRTRLLAAFEKVNANFTALFQTLFEGGAASLHLTENDDPLAAGLEVLAQPPGKKLSALSLMSGGEQALTATALIFAVFLANPAPLCVLDEVDAPLDDANVDRFCRMLDEMRKRTDTRFIVITHNPVTMSRMDRLFGVTMVEPGVSQLVSVDLGRARQLAAV
ncbi:MAG: AAA family ATPase [Alphaproteobacteria bacterium]|nr:AAA family ATPase [Alphaproteobacteria bacterium]